jgi:phosphoserine phosphatase RsbU/P
MDGFEKEKTKTGCAGAEADLAVSSPSPPVDPLLAELDLARKIQQLLLPKSSPVCTWCCTAVKNRMAAHLGGDYFDFITMPDDCQALFIGDVTGHGIHASVVMSLIYGFIHRAANGICAPVGIVSQTNDFLISFGSRSDELDHLFSSTLFFGIINPLTKTLQYVNAGHVPPLVKRKKRLLELPANSQPIGFFEKPELRLSTFHFEKDDRLLLYTDGIVETTGKDGSLYGDSRLRRLLLHEECDHEEFLEHLFADLSAFVTDAPPEDDSTAIVLDLHGLGTL